MVKRNFGWSTPVKIGRVNGFYLNMCYLVYHQHIKLYLVSYLGGGSRPSWIVWFGVFTIIDLTEEQVNSRIRARLLTCPPGDRAEDRA